MQRIEMGTTVPTLDGKPLPPWPYYHGEEAELGIRLASTRGGNNAWWQCSDTARCRQEGSLNGAPYCPVLMAVVQNFSWAPLQTRDRPEVFVDFPFKDALDSGSDLPTIIQGGSATPPFTWRATVVRSLPDSWRAIFNAIAEIYVRGIHLTPQIQGHLWVFPLADFSGEIHQQVTALINQGELSSYGNGWTFFNHFLGYPTPAHVWRVRGQTAYGLIQTGETYILSADHPDDPLLLQSGLYVLTHPLPQDKTD